MKSKRDRSRRHFRIYATIAIVWSLGFSACSPNSGLTDASDSGANGYDPNSVYNPASNVNPLSASDTGQVPSLAGVTGGGSGASGAFDGNDISGINDAISGVNQVNPSGATLTADQIQSAQSILAAASAGQDTSAQRAALVASIMQTIIPLVAGEAPKPGQPLMGDYVAKCPALKGYTNGTIHAGYNGAYPNYILNMDFPKTMDGRPMTAQGDGTSQILVKPSSTNLTKLVFYDAPVASTATLNIQNAAAKYKCQATMSFKNSRNPIPENSANAMKQLADMYRKIILFNGPLFDEMFKTMPPQVAAGLLASIINVPLQ